MKPVHRTGEREDAPDEHQNLQVNIGSNPVEIPRGKARNNIIGTWAMESPSAPIPWAFTEGTLNG